MTLLRLPRCDRRCVAARPVKSGEGRIVNFLDDLFFDACDAGPLTGERARSRMTVRTGVTFNLGMQRFDSRGGRHMADVVIETIGGSESGNRKREQDQGEGKSFHWNSDVCLYINRCGNSKKGCAAEAISLSGGSDQSNPGRNRRFHPELVVGHFVVHIEFDRM